MTLPAFTVGPPPQPEERRFWEWITQFWRWAKAFADSAETDLTSLESRVTALEEDVEDIMSAITDMNELMADLLTEARITNHYLYELPTQLNAGANQPVTDEPEAFRKDPTVFKQ